MAAPVPRVHEHDTLIKAFSGLGGLGVDESALIAAAAKWRKEPEIREGFRKRFTVFFKEHGSFQRCEDDYIKHLKIEFARFKSIMVLWAMHPWERDARWIHHVLHKAHPFAIIVEIACTRSSEELLGTRKAYQALFHHSIEEDVAYHVKANYSNLLVGLVSAYRYEGPRVNEEMAKSEAKILGAAIKNASQKKPVENEDVIRIITTRSKQHLKVTFKYYKEIHKKSVEEDLGNEFCLLETVQCLDSAPNYFSNVIHKSFNDGADKKTKDALSRVIVSRADVDMEEIKATYNKKNGVKLEDMIQKHAHGNYRDALLSLVGK